MGKKEPAPAIDREPGAGYCEKEEKGPVGKEKLMCGRYYFAPELEELQRIIDEINRRAAQDATPVKVGEICPTDTVPVIANSRALKPRPFLMRWSFAKPNGKGVIINARSETAAAMPMFRDPLD
jgi:putative SOS response-associated peptidase YedK